MPLSPFTAEGAESPQWGVGWHVMAGAALRPLSRRLHSRDAAGWAATTTLVRVRVSVRVRLRVRIIALGLGLGLGLGFGIGFGFGFGLGGASTPMMRRQTTSSGHAELVEAVSGMGTRTSKKPPPVTTAWKICQP